jgi:prevent-host-death family protein
MKKWNRGSQPKATTNVDRGAELAKRQESMSKASFARYLTEGRSANDGSRSSAYRWMRNSRALADAIPYRLAREVLLEVTHERGLFSAAGGLSDGYASGLRKHPIPAEGTSYEECLDWAREIQVVAGHHVNLSAAPESWQIQSAKARFSEVFRRARTEGPQRITRQGKEGVVMVAEEEYERLAGMSQQPRNLVDFFRGSPLVGIELDLERDRDPGRDIKL